MKKLYYIIYIGIFMLLLAGCQDEGMFTPESDGDEPVYVTYRVQMGDETLSRAIGDANKVNELKVGVFEGENLQKVFAFKKDVNAEAFTNVTLPLLKWKKYNLVFWAQKEGNDIYTIDENFNITINYDEYQNISLAGTEDFEAFTEVKNDVSVANPGDATITLTRPFAQLNIAASENDIFNEVNKVSFTINNVYKKFNPLTGVSSEEETDQEFSYSFSRQDIAAKQAITIGGTDYYYLASAYLLAPENVNLTGGLYEGDKLVKEMKVTELPLYANTRTNIYGDMIQQEELQGWDGITFTEPELKNNQYIIDEESDIAWLTVPSNVASLSASTFFVDKDVLNMGDKPISSIQLPAGSTFDGNGKTIKCFANSLFGNATNITVQNLTLDYVKATSSDSHVGVLVNTLTGSSTFTGISITNSSATTTNGAAGGMIGYITNKEGETLQVTISACTTTGNAVDGSKASGIYVGRFRGYDNSETLTFSSDNNASSATTTTGKSSYYVSDNVAAWLSENDYSKYSGFLGDEEFYRGTVNYGEVRFVPKWDGHTTIEPIYEDVKTKKVAQIWSAFDLAYLQEKTLTTLRFKSDVDMSGVCADCKDGKGNSTIANDDLSTCDKCKVFKPITAINNLYGENHTLHNLFVQGVHKASANSNNGMAFISYTNSGTFENFTFDGAVIKCIDDIDYRNDDQIGGNGYAGTLTSRVAAKMTIKNVHAKNGHVIGISKFGGLIGYVPGGIEANNCSVDNYVVENHKIYVNNSYSVSIEKVISGVKAKAECAENFYTEGEAGGFIGFINSNATITDCHTSNITMKCYGQKDRKTKITCYTWGKQFVFFGKEQWNKVLDIDYTIAGRHINTFIGDIRTPNSNTIVINGCTTSGKCAEGYDYNITKEGKGELVGCCYFVGKDIELVGKSMHAGDYQGSVIIDGESMPFVGG